MIDVDVPVYAFGLGPMCEVFVMIASVLQFIVFVPILQVARHLWVYVSILIYKVNALIQIYYNMEKQVYSLTRLEYRRHHRNTKELTELAVVKTVAPVLKLIVHIQRTYHAQVHIHKLCGEIKVTFKIARIYYVYDKIRSLVYNLSAYI